MESSPFAKQIKYNLWLYNRELIQLAERRKIRNSLRNWLKSLEEYKDLIVGTSDWKYGLINPNLVSIVRNEELISAIIWELEYLDGVIKNFKERLLRYKNQPIWIPLG